MDDLFKDQVLGQPFRMGRLWRIGFAASAVLIALMVGAGIWLDRDATISEVEQAALTNARLIAAHGDASLGEAQQVASAILPKLQSWETADRLAAEAIHHELQDLARYSSRVTSAWVTDNRGISIFDSWTFPAEPIPSSERTYFQRHLAGEEDPVISESQRGSVSGLRRFTYSHAVRDESGELQAVLVVGLHTDTLSILFDELAEISRAFSGLYKVRGDILAESSEAEEIGLSSVVGQLPAVANEIGILRHSIDRPLVVGWRMSSEFPGVVSLSAIDLSAALGAWRKRALAAATLGAALLALIFVLARTLIVRAGEREQMERVEFAAREVSHRMKNSLQMIGSFLRLRTRHIQNEETLAELRLISSQLLALSRVQELLEITDEPGRVDLTSVIERLCQEIEASHAARVERSIGEAFPTDSATAGRLAILTNELIINAMKHGNGRVHVQAESADGRYDVIVANGGEPLPDGFDPAGQSGFGLKAACGIAESIGATLTAHSGGRLGGAEFRISLPGDGARDRNAT